MFIAEDIRAQMRDDVHNVVAQRKWLPFGMSLVLAGWRWVRYYGRPDFVH